ncbi:putative NAD-dependent epimerase/dehydratase family protein [Enterobacter sp. BIGb0383]|uniref:N-acetyltransferase DgcN n=1 Tax=unclassified Enterobacter TaxID=2608935 RepID=UPI000F46FB88|nr:MULTISPECIES: N-acetyltransferase DgcN [unclassified Enterobacter]ROP59971.1 putative NAD-dependent epimerase/dehydratase family protein [Enterobacter sp. BIGb0383]ROS08560.1 putative NAD-dependent epimerase/dehydratase family protein [Enterobacter sp. BIGb0359]
MIIPQPYLLFLGDVTDPLAAKTARGISVWRPEQCIGEMRLPGGTVSLGLDELDIATARARGAQTLVLGTANAGGFLPEHWKGTVRAAIEAGMNVASGLHYRLADDAELSALAAEKGVELFDIRHMRPELQVGSGKKRSGKRLLTVGTDCSVGKMYTSLALEAAMREIGLKADFRATGQTGILVAGEGIAIDAVIADFIAGAAEYLSPANEDDHWDIVEGQGSLFHPSYAGVSTGLIHGAQPQWLLMCHEMGRPHMRHLPHQPMVSLEECVEANMRVAKVTSERVELAGFAINSSNYGEQEARDYLATISAQFGVPATDPVRFGIADIALRLKEHG